MTFGQSLRQAREQLHLSQEVAARTIEKSYNVRLSAAYLSMIENGVKTNLTVKVINALLGYFQLPLYAAASLFSQAAPPRMYDQSEANTSLRETTGAYPAEQSQLSEEAKRTLQEFSDFLHYKYDKKREQEQISFNNQ